MLALIQRWATFGKIIANFSADCVLSSIVVRDGGGINSCEVCLCTATHTVWCKSKRGGNRLGPSICKDCSVVFGEIFALIDLTNSDNNICTVVRASSTINIREQISNAAFLTWVVRQLEMLEDVRVHTFAFYVVKLMLSDQALFAVYNVVTK